MKLCEPHSDCTNATLSLRSDHLWMAIYFIGSYTKLHTKQTLKIKSKAVCSISSRLVQDCRSLCIFNFLKYRAQWYQWLFFFLDCWYKRVHNSGQTVKPNICTSLVIVSRESVVETFLLLAEMVHTPGAGYSKCNQWSSGLFSIDTLDLAETSGDGNHAGQIHHVFVESEAWETLCACCIY